MCELGPVSLIPDLGKGFEGLVAEMLLSDIRPMLNEKQYGNLKGRSTSHYLIYILDTILKGLDRLGTMAILMLIEFKKSFDFVDHLSRRPSILGGRTFGS